ncbi:MFS transporter [Streptomyces sp. AgN23]|nr:MFS transporter [Streptomyces sp. AgN23]
MERSPGVFAPQWRLTSIGIAVAISLFAFEGLAVATAMPSAVRELRGLAFFGWAYSAFLVMNLVGLGAAGQWCDRVGPRKPLLTGIAVFTVGLLVAGTAVNMALFVLGRGAQGIGVGLASTAVFKIVATAYPSELRPRALAIISAAYVVPALVGPILSGTITAHAGWRWVFLGLVPLALACAGALLPALRTSDAPGSAPAGGFRKPLFALLAGGGVVALQSGGNAVVAGRTPLAVLLLGVGLLALVAGLRELLPRGATRLRRGGTRRDRGARPAGGGVLRRGVRRAVDPRHAPRLRDCGCGPAPARGIHRLVGRGPGAGPDHQDDEVVAASLGSHRPGVLLRGHGGPVPRGGSGVAGVPAVDRGRTGHGGVRSHHRCTRPRTVRRGRDGSELVGATDQ